MFHKYNFVLIKWWVQIALLILSSLLSWLKREIFFNLVGRWINWSSQRISSFELVRDLLSFKFFKSFKCFSSPLNVLQVLQRFLRHNFSRVWASWKLGVENELGYALFIVVLEDKLHFELICLKVNFWLTQILLRDNYLYLSILINIIFW